MWNIYVWFFFVCLQRQLSSKEKPAAETQFDLEINSFPPLPPGPVPAVCIHLVHLPIEFTGRYIVYIVMITFISTVNISDHIVNSKYITSYGKL